MLDKYDTDCTYSYIFGKKGMKWLKTIKLEGNDQVQINNYINNIEFLNNEINEIDKKISLQAVKNQDVKILDEYDSYRLLFSHADNVRNRGYI